MPDLGALLRGREAHLQLLPLAQLLRHAVERRRETPDLVVPVDGHGHVEPARGDGRRAVGEDVERARGVLRDDEHHREADREDAEERIEAPPEVVRELLLDVLERVADADMPVELAVERERDQEDAVRRALSDEAGDEDVARRRRPLRLLLARRSRLRLGERPPRLRHLDVAQPLRAELLRVVAQDILVLPPRGADLSGGDLDRLGERLVGRLGLVERLVARPEIDERLRGGREDQDSGQREAEARREAEAARPLLHTVRESAHFTDPTVKPAMKRSRKRL